MKAPELVGEKGRQSSRPFPAYRSPLRRHVRSFLIDYPKASALEICGYLDEEAVDTKAFPEGWLAGGNRELSVAYQDPKIGPRIDSYISKVRRHLGLGARSR